MGRRRRSVITAMLRIGCKETRHPRLGIRRRTPTRVAGNPRSVRRLAPAASGKVYRRIPQVYGQTLAAIQRATCSGREVYSNPVLAVHRHGEDRSSSALRHGSIKMRSSRNSTASNDLAQKSIAAAEVPADQSRNYGRRFGTAHSRRIDAQSRAARDGLSDLVLRRARLVGCSAWLAGRLREARHRLSDAWLSPDGKPLRSPSTEMSSSRSGQ
jgi:hypothetical protein